MLSITFNIIQHGVVQLAIVVHDLPAREQILRRERVSILMKGLTIHGALKGWGNFYKKRISRDLRAVITYILYTIYTVRT